VIRILVLDIDGVLTSGEVWLGEDGRESKTLFFRDIDALSAARREGRQIVLVTGEATPLVEVIARRLQLEHVYRGAKDKAAALRSVSVDLGVPLDEIGYVGDAPRDAPALELAGLGLAPADAAAEALEAADRVLTHAGGRGAVAEAIGIVFGASPAR
jgi:3-deoxy-D-manno-octulosonate 8-phosphate phosphatase (KDO 8-P phosphatase)